MTSKYLTEPLRGYQNTIIKDAEDLLYKEGKVAICAVCNAGKTRIAREMIKNYLEKNPEEKVLVLAHGQKMLCKQFLDDLKNAGIDAAQFSSGNGDFPDSKVVVSLPHSNYRESSTLPKFGFVVVDEAHQFYWVANKDGSDGMVTKVLKKAQPKHLLLLTASGAKFVAADFPRIMFSEEELYTAQKDDQKLYQAEVTTLLVQTPYNLKDGDYNTEGEVVTKYEFNSRDTENALYTLMDELLNKLENRDIGNHPESFNECSSSGLAAFRNKLILRLKRFAKTLFTPDYANNKIIIIVSKIQQGKQVLKIVKALGFPSVLSHSKNDAASQITEDFKGDSNQILIVVDRCRLGYNLATLCHCIDMTLSENPVTIAQIRGRVLRVDPKNPNRRKVFLRAIPKDRMRTGEYATCFALTLSLREYYKRFDGKYNPIPMDETRKVRIGGKGGRPRGPRVVDMDDYLSTSVNSYFLDMQKHLPHTDDSNAARSYVTRKDLFNWNAVVAGNKITLENMIKNGEPRPSSKKTKIGKALCSYMDDKEFVAKMRLLDSDPLVIAKRTDSKVKEWFPELMGDYQFCLADARKYPSFTEWVKGSRRKYNKAYHAKFLDPIKTELQLDGTWPALKKSKWTEEEIWQSAREANSSGKSVYEWYKRASGAYNAAGKMGIFNKIKGELWPDKTFDQILTSARRSETCRAWRAGEDSTDYESAKYRKILPEINRIRTKENKGWRSRTGIKKHPMEESNLRPSD